MVTLNIATEMYMIYCIWNLEFTRYIYVLSTPAPTYTWRSGRGIMFNHQQWMLAMHKFLVREPNGGNHIFRRPRPPGVAATD